jgi:death on curing protein
VTRYLSVNEVLDLHSRVMHTSGGSLGIHDLGALESTVAQPRLTFDGIELYPTLSEKATALGFSLIQDHPFIDGNKRTRHASLKTFTVSATCTPFY